MKKHFILMFSLIMFLAYGWEIESYSAAQGPGALLLNPAMTALSGGTEIFYGMDGLGRGGILSSLSGTGLGLEFNGDEQVFWHYSTAYREDNFLMGFSYHSDLSKISRQWWGSAGMAYLFRRARIGMVYEWGDRRELILSLGVKPFEGLFALTLSADGYYDLQDHSDEILNNVTFHLGGELKIGNRLGIFGDYYLEDKDSWQFYGGISLSFQDKRISASYLDETHYRISSTVYSDDGTDKKYGKKARIYTIDLNGEYSYFPFKSSGLLAFVSGKGQKDLMLLVQSILDQVQEDSVRGFFMEIGPNNLSISQIMELRLAFKKFLDQDSGRELVIKLPPSASLKDYYLASAATKIIMDRGASVFLTGLGGKSLYFAGAMKKFGIKGEFYRPDECTYKSASESYMREGPSPEAKENLEAVLSDIYNLIADEIAVSRGIDIRELSKENFLFSASSAQRTGLIDTFDKKLPEKYFDAEYMAFSLRKRFSDSWEYRETRSLPMVILEGTVNDNATGGGMPFNRSQGITPSLWKKMIEKLKSHPSDSIILLVNSPGGSGSASDRIFEMTEELKQSGKKLYVYMLDVAGSGGYYISMNAQRIYSSPFTITGSIGVIGGKISFAGALEKLGIGIGEMSVGDNSDVFSPYTPFTEFQQRKFKLFLEDFYDLFLARASESRGIEIGKMKQLAQGKIYSGVAAASNGLIDETCSLFELVQKLSKEEGYKTVNIERLGTGDNLAILPGDLEAMISYFGFKPYSPLFLMEPFIIGM